MIRQLASRPTERVGTLFFNPGGPGSFGVDALNDKQSPEALDCAGAGRFDVISWDPRGVGDPNTAYARATARRLGNAVLLTHTGHGHISFVDPSSCVLASYRRYLTQLRMPARGTVCPSDRGPFDPEFGEAVP